MPRSTFPIVALLVLLGVSAALFLVDSPSEPTSTPPLATDPAQTLALERPDVEATPTVAPERADAPIDVLPPAGPPSTYANALGSIIGRIIESDGTPREEMRVEIVGGNPYDLLPQAMSWFDDSLPELRLVEEETFTHEEGRFRFDGVDPHGLFLLAVDHGGPRSMIRVMDASPRPGEVVDLGDIELNPQATLIGRVVDEESVPIANARVRTSTAPTIAYQYGLGKIQRGCAIAAEIPNSDTWSWFPLPGFALTILDRLPIPETVTDEEGRFRIEGAPVGIVTLVIDKEGYAQGIEGPIPTSEGGERTLPDIALPVGEELVVRVVQGEDELPVSNAEVMAGTIFPFFPVSLLVPIGKTDRDGFVRATGFTGEEVVVAVRGPEQSGWQFEIDQIPGIDEPVFRLEETVTLTLLARDETGETLRRPRVLLRRGDEVSNSIAGADPLAGLLISPPVPIRRRVDLEDGSVRLEGLPRDPFYAIVGASGYSHKEVQADLKGGSKTVEVTLEPELTGTVHVVETGTSEPIHFALTAAYSSEVITPLCTRRTDENGIAELSALVAGENHIRIFHPAYAIETAVLTVPGPPIRVELRAGGSIEGIVRDSGSLPSEQQMVLAFPKESESTSSDPKSPMVRITLTDPDGAFQLSHLTVGVYEVSVMPRLDSFSGFDAVNAGPGNGGFAMNLLAGQNDPSTGDEDFGPGGGDDSMSSTKRTVEVREGDVAYVEIDLRQLDGDGPRARLLGSVVLNGRTYPDMRVSATPAGTFSSRSDRTDASGRFNVGEVAAKSVMIRVSSPSAEEVVLYATRITLEPDETRQLELRIETGSLSGRVLSEVDGSPLEYAKIELVPYRAPSQKTEDGEAAPADPTFEANRYVRLHTATANNGTFAFDAVPGGEFILNVSAKGHAPIRSDPITIPKRSSATPVTLRLIGAVDVDGTIELPAGVGEVTYLFVAMQNKEGGSGFASANRATGEFIIRDVAPGDYTFHIVGTSVDLEPIEMNVPTSGLHGVVLRPTLKVKSP